MSDTPEFLVALYAACVVIGFIMLLMIMWYVVSVAAYNLCDPERRLSCALYIIYAFQCLCGTNNTCCPSLPMTAPNYIEENDGNAYI